MQFNSEAHGSTVIGSNAVLTDAILTSITITNYLIIFYVVVLESVETVEKVGLFFYNHHFKNCWLWKTCVKSGYVFLKVFILSFRFNLIMLVFHKFFRFFA